MNLRSLATRLLVICSALCAFAFAGDDDAFFFSLSSSQIFFPGSAETAVEFSGNSVGRQTVYMRAFKVPDPADFFLSQSDPHNPRLNAGTPPNTFDMIRQGYQKVSRDARYAARDVMPADARRAIRDVADLNGTKAEQAKEKRTPKPPQSSSGLPVDDIPKGAERYPIVAAWEYQLTPKENDENWHYESIAVPIKEKGVYLIEARTRGKRSITALVISEYGMVVKQSNTELLTFVVNTRTGERVTDFPITVTRGGEKLSEKQTGSDGTLRTPVPPLPAVKQAADEDDEDSWRWDYRRHMVVVLGEKDGNFVINDPYFYSYGGNNSRVYLHTDRPVYRPGQVVYYRGIARRVNEDGTYALPGAGDSIFVEIQDSRGDMVRRDTLRVSDLGTFDGQLTLADEPPLGDYSIKITRSGATSSEDEQWFNFGVEEYKKPEYKVTVTTDRANYTRGDKVSATVKADYFFGSPVANAEVEYFVYRSRYWRPWWSGSDWAYLYGDSEDDDFSSYRMEMVSSGKGALNPDGTFAISYTTDPAADVDYTYRIQANVVDASRRAIVGSKSVVVTRGAFYISTHTDHYVYKPGDDAKIDVSISTFDGDRPVATAFTATVIRNWWDKVKNDTLEGGFEYKKRTETIWSGNGTTDPSGKGSITYKTAQAGYFEVEISARDQRMTTITESSYIYVADSRYANWYREGSGEVQIIPDKPAYAPGETMNALVIMPAANLDALVTIEGSTIFSSHVERLNGTSAVIHFPVEERYAPSVYISASAMANDEMYTETQHVSVVPEGKLLKLEVTANRELYRPGDKGTVMVRAVDEKGSPVSNVDVAIGMVDESIYSIRPDATPDIQRYFYGNRWNEVSTSSSLNFSFYGDATKIDKDATDALYGVNGRGEPVRAGAALADKGRNGRSLAFGDVKGNMFLQPVTRKNFKDMMFWTPSVRTGSDGRAQVEVTFPDNLTTWRITARGVTGQTAVGAATARVIARKDLLVRMETPRFLIQGDELLVATTVHNYLSSEKLTKVELTGDNVSMADRERTVTIPANGEKRIDWKVTAPRTGNAVLTVKALTNEESDAMELAVPVLPSGMRLATGASAEIAIPNGSRAMNLTLPTGADPANGEVYVTLSPSLAGSFLGALDSLIGYPYGCVEQTMSRFLPTVVVADALRRLDLPFDEKRRAEIPKMVAKGLNKLYGMQHEDGGWGWWQNDQTDPFMTAYVIYGMTVARSAGYGVSDERFESGTRALEQLVESRQKPDGKTVDATSEAYMLYVMSIVNKGKPVKMLTDRIAALARRDTLNEYGRALLAMASSYQGMRDQAQALVSKLETSAVTGDEYAYWQPKGARYYWQNDAVEASAAALRALMELRGGSPLVEKGVRWILSQKIGDEWHSTRQTAMVIYSLVDYVKSAGELSPSYTVTVKVNGEQLYSRQMTRADVFAPEQRVKLQGAKLRSGANTVTVEKNGEGRLYSSARMIYYATGPALRSASAGFKVTREYWVLRRERRGDVIVHTKSPYNGTVRSGDELFVKVKVVPDRRYEYFMLEDPLPAGCEVIQNTRGYTIPGEADYDPTKRDEDAMEWAWDWWYADRNVRDEKVSFFAREIPAKPFEFSYILRAQIPGRYAVMPAVGTLMYYPEVRGNSDAMAMTIQP